MPVKIVQKENPILRLEALPVTKEEIGSKRIKDVISKMRIAVNQEEDGVAIAAPQIGESLRIFVVAGRAQAIIDGEEKDSSKYKDLIFINPEIVKSSRKKRKMEEGCLSVRWLYGKVERSERVVLRALDEDGKKIERGATGLMAQIFQHEVDHLNGVLFIDKAEELEDLPPEKENAE